MQDGVRGFCVRVNGVVIAAGKRDDMQDVFSCLSDVDTATEVNSEADDDGKVVVIKTDAQIIMEGCLINE